MIAEMVLKHSCNHSTWMEYSTLSLHHQEVEIFAELQQIKKASVTVLFQQQLMT